MKTLRMEDVEKIGKMLADDKAVGIVWQEKNGGDRYFDIVDSVISGVMLVLRSGAVVYARVDKLEEIREVA